MKRRLAKFGAVREPVISERCQPAGCEAGAGFVKDAAATSAFRLPLRRFAGDMAALGQVQYRVRKDETPVRDTTYV